MKWIWLVVLCLQLQADLPPRFIAALHYAESRGKTNRIKDGDGGRAIGPFQIHKIYWKSAMEFRNLGGTYQDCRKYDYSVKVVNACMERWASEHIKAGNWEAVARIHTGGPNGWKRNTTKRYGAVVTNHMKKLCH